MSIININHLTKDYGNGKGVFNVSIQVNKGEVYGYLGPNGAGKSTTMRHLMGFSKPEKGTVTINGLDCWADQKEIQKILGYLPGEIAFLDDMTGLQYLHLIADMRGMKDFSKAEKILNLFEMNPNPVIKRMSKGMKQKIGITAAFMHNPEIILLDEPTSGLDPLMQKRFIDLVLEEKSNGKTIILSSHIFEEVEKACDRIGIIRSGKLIKEISMDELRNSMLKTYKIQFKTYQDLEKMKTKFIDAKFTESQNEMTISINDKEINKLIKELSTCDLHSLKEERHTLEEYFMQFYGGDKNV